MNNANWVLGLWAGGGKVINDHGRDTKLLLSGVHLGKVFRNWSNGVAMELAVEAAPVFVVFQSSTVYGAEVAPLLMKWHFGYGGRVDPYLEAGGGLLFSSAEVPERTSTFNFTPQLRFGFEFPLQDNRAFSVAIQYVHISNAQTAERNRGYNSLHLQLGYVWDL
jgi:hypothetical protein